MVLGVGSKGSNNRAMCGEEEEKIEGKERRKEQGEWCGDSAGNVHRRHAIPSDSKLNQDSMATALVLSLLFLASAALLCHCDKIQETQPTSISPKIPHHWKSPSAGLSPTSLSPPSFRQIWTVDASASLSHPNPDHLLPRNGSTNPENP
ncbi:hypothetical protein CKAN_02643500 [Cinnamomum micranthum f. kanehirae]|uniref:Uncharacterized protein n=1 Tax=Cinnamomum micranthum f. kanehirae TaxID=337451 RepID=A0A443Q1Z1_9MAGN|nr:hypothetical protein CKAN_02643500 [Cinnamomum micranthum f. kanehirae]